MSQAVDNWFMRQTVEDRKRINSIVNAVSTDDSQRSRIQEVICIELMQAEDRAYRRGIAAAAAFAGEWDGQITGTAYSMESIILGKFNLIPKSKMKRKKIRKQT